MNKMLNWEYRSVIAVAAVSVALMFCGYKQNEICLATTVLAALAAATFTLLAFVSVNTTTLVAAAISASVAAIVAVFNAAMPMVTLAATGTATGENSVAFDLTLFLIVTVAAAFVATEFAVLMLKIKYIWAFLGLFLEGVVISAILRYGVSTAPILQK